MSPTSADVVDDYERKSMALEDTQFPQDASAAFIAVADEIRDGSLEPFIYTT